MHSKILATILAAATSFAVSSIGVQAMPAGPNVGAGAAPHVTLAAQGCGVGFARGPLGGCRPIARGPVVVVPARPVVVAPRAGCGVRVGPVGVRTPC